MKASEVAIPQSAFDNRRSPLTEGTFTEYAVKAGGSVLNHKRFATPQDAHFYGCALQNAKDRERYGRVMVKREVVMRRVHYGKWENMKGGAS